MEVDARGDRDVGELEAPAERAVAEFRLAYYSKPSDVRHGPCPTRSRR
jgi:hypothetical protein